MGNAAHRQSMNKNTVGDENNEIMANKELHRKIALRGRQKEIIKYTRNNGHHSAIPIGNIPNEKRRIPHAITLYTIDLPIVESGINKIA